MDINSRPSSAVMFYRSSVKSKKQVIETTTDPGIFLMVNPYIVYGYINAVFRVGPETMATDWRTRSFVPIRIFLERVSGVTFCLFWIRCINSSTVSFAMACFDTLMEVRGGSVTSQDGRSLNPMMEMSPGICMPRSENARMAPTAIVSSSQTKAVGSCVVGFPSRNARMSRQLPSSV